MKKHATIALILVLTAALLAGCRNPNDTTGTTAATTTTPITQPTTAATTMPTSLPATSESTAPQDTGMTATDNTTIGESGTVGTEPSGTGAADGSKGRSNGGVRGGR